MLGLNPFAVAHWAKLAVNCADAVLPVPVSFELIWPVVLVKISGVPCVDCNARTATEKVHDPLAAILPPDRLIKPVLGVAVIVAPAPHPPVRPLGF